MRVELLPDFSDSVSGVAVLFLFLESCGLSSGRSSCRGLGVLEDVLTRDTWRFVSFFLTQLGYEQVWAEAIGDLICQERKGEKLKKMMINPEDRKLNSYTVPVF